MRAVNHAVTGALIGMVVGEPAIAIPAAIASHFVCDALPHYDEGQEDKTGWIKSVRFRNLLIIDAILCVSFVALLAADRPAHWLLAAICAFCAAAPDLVWFKWFLYSYRGKKYKLKGFVAFAQKIQWFARPIGAFAEAAWLTAAIILLIPFLR